MGQIPAFVLLLAATSHAVASQGTARPGAEPETSLTVEVKTPDGRPMSNVTVVCVGSSTNAFLNGTAVEGGDERLQTDDEGRFNLPSIGTNIALVVADDTGFCLAQSRDLAVDPTMVVRPWGRIDGVRLNRGQPVA